MELSELERIMAKNNQIIAGLKQGHALTLQSLVWQAILNCWDGAIIRLK